MRVKDNDALVTGAISKCWNHEIDSRTLVAILAGERLPGVWEPHLGMFFSELSTRSSIRFLLRHALLGGATRRVYLDYVASGRDRNPVLEEWLRV